jgi:three-Cys-motif partner protein
MITKHGTYIDACAGPQQPENPEMWAARLVIESQPRWFRKFFLFDSDPEKIELLEKLRDSQPPRDINKREPDRLIHVELGDCNVLIPKLLSSGKIRHKEATFCLLDQRTFECEWATLEALSKYKANGRKIELFYFLAHAWLGRAMANQKDNSVLEKWWGSPDYVVLKDIPPGNRVLLFIERFRQELGYWSVRPWPIYDSINGGRIMYYMIHATDHPAAPLLMQRAYSKAVEPPETIADLQLEFGI